jgi:hypothetical protein
VVLRQIRKDETNYDRDAREPIGRATRDTDVGLFAQISRKPVKVKASREGDIVEYDGYVCFLKTDLVANGITIKYHDQIIQIGTGAAREDVSIYIEMIQPRGHNSNYGGHTLVKAWFRDKSPVRHF